MRYCKYIETQPATNVWVENIPNHWLEKRLCFMIKTTKGFAFKSEHFSSSGVSVVKASDIKNKTILKSDIFLPESFSKTHKQVLLNEGDIIISTVGSTPDVKNSAVGQIGKVSKLCDGSLLNQNTVILRPESDIDNDYLLYILSSNEFREHLDLHAHGTANQASLSLNDILDFTAILPPAEEQRKIAAFLNFKTQQIDQLIEKKKSLIEKLEEKRIAVITQAVTKGIDENAKLKPSCVDWLGDIPEHWDITRTKFNVSHIGSGKTPSGGSEVYVEDGIMMLRSQNVYDDGLRLSNVVRITEEADSLQLSSRINDHDVLLNITGASIGRASIVPLGFPISNVNQHVCIVRPEQEKIDPRYLHLQLCSHVAKHQIMMNQVGTSREGLTFPQVGDLTFSLPSLVEQQEILEFCENETIQNKLMKQKIELAISKLKEYRSAIITSAVTGEIDVREIDMAAA